MLSWASHVLTNGIIAGAAGKITTLAVLLVAHAPLPAVLLITNPHVAFNT